MKLFWFASLMVLLVSVGCVNPVQPVDEANTIMDDHMDDNAMMDDSGDMMEEKVAYAPFTQTAYDKARAEGKTIFLEFYANWCPICKAQAPSLEEGLNSIHSDQLVAFRVNYNDNETDASEQALAQQFNVTYQHTHILIDGQGKELLRSNEQWSASDVTNKIGAFV